MKFRTFKIISMIFCFAICIFVPINEDNINIGLALIAAVCGGMALGISMVCQDVYEDAQRR